MQKDRLKNVYFDLSTFGDSILSKYAKESVYRPNNFGLIIASVPLRSIHESSLIKLFSMLALYCMLIHFKNRAYDKARSLRWQCVRLYSADYLDRSLEKDKITYKQWKKIKV